MKLKLPHTIPQKVLEGLTIGILLLQFLLPVLLWNRLPDPMPTHYNAAGEIDGWGSRWTVFLTPGISLAMWALLSLVTRLDPKHWNMPFPVPYGREVPVYSAVKTTLTAMKLEMMIIFAGVEAVTVTGAGRWIGLATALPCVAMAVTLIAGMVIAYRRRY